MGTAIESKTSVRRCLGAACLLAGALVGGSPRAEGNSFIIDFTPATTPVVEDLFYADGESAVFLPGRIPGMNPPCRLSAPGKSCCCTIMSV